MICMASSFHKKFKILRWPYFVFVMTLNFACLYFYIINLARVPFVPSTKIALKFTQITNHEQ